MFVDDLKKMIVDASLGVAGTNLFWSSHAKIPAGPGPFTSLIEYAGLQPEILHQSSSVPAYEYPNAQVFARGENHDATVAKAMALYQLLVQNPTTKLPWRNVTINGTYYVWLIVRQSPFDMGPDDVGRLKFGFNVSGMKRP